MRLAALLLFTSMCLLSACMTGGSSTAPTTDPKSEPAMTTSAHIPPPDDLLSAHAWQLAGPVVAPRPWLELSAGKVGGENSCNGFSGAYSVDGARLSFGPLAQSKRFCTATADQERRFMEGLRQTQGYRVLDGRLELLDSNGQVLLTLETRGGADDAR